MSNNDSLKNLGTDYKYGFTTDVKNVFERAHRLIIPYFFQLSAQIPMYHAVVIATPNVVVENNRIVAAKCILPVTQSPVPKSYGTRHRAAIGITETSDAVVVVVSEESGAISIVKAGQIKHNVDPQKLGFALKKALGQQK